MRKWKYVEPIDEAGTPQWITVTEEDIIRDYYPRWAEEVKRVCKDEPDAWLDKERCIEDFIIVYWAWELTE